jgi:hypothetical protein
VAGIPAAAVQAAEAEWADAVDLLFSERSPVVVR